MRSWTTFDPALISNSMEKKFLPWSKESVSSSEHLLNMLRTFEVKQDLDGSIKISEDYGFWQSRKYLTSGCDAVKDHAGHVRAEKTDELAKHISKVGKITEDLASDRYMSLTKTKTENENKELLVVGNRSHVPEECLLASVDSVNNIHAICKNRLAGATDFVQQEVEA